MSGTRVVGKGKQQTVGGIAFTGYGSHTDTYPHVYLTAAAALGGSEAEADAFCARLTRCVREALSKQQKNVQGEDMEAQARAESQRGTGTESQAKEKPAQ